MPLTWTARLALLTALSALAAPALAWTPPKPTLPNERHIILFCTVSDSLTATDCRPRPGKPASAGDTLTQAFIAEETDHPDYLAGAKPGAGVWVMVRRSVKAPLDDLNPGRAQPPVPAAPPPAPIHAPDWRIMPSAETLAGYYPDYAARNAISGAATAQCTVGPSGDLLGCWLASETPPDAFLGTTTLTLTTLVQLKPTTKDGSPTAGGVCAFRAGFAVDVKRRTAEVSVAGGD